MQFCGHLLEELSCLLWVLCLDAVDHVEFEEAGLQFGNGLGLVLLQAGEQLDLQVVPEVAEALEVMAGNEAQKAVHQSTIERIIDTQKKFFLLMFLLVAAKSLFPLVLELRLEGLEGGNESPEDEVFLDEVVQHVVGGHLRRRGHDQEHGQGGPLGLHCSFSRWTLLAKSNVNFVYLFGIGSISGLLLL